MTQSRLTTCDRCGKKIESLGDLEGGWVRVHKKGEYGTDICSTCWDKAFEKPPDD